MISLQTPDQYIDQFSTVRNDGGINDIYIDTEGNMYIATSYPNDAIYEYDASGTLLSSWGTPGIGNGQFSNPSAVAVNNGYIYVADSYNNRISVFSNDYTPPLVAVTAPTASSTVSGTITLTASSTDTQSGLASIQFQVDGNNVGTVGTSSPYSISYDASGLSAGAHAITAIAYDNVGNYATSTPVTITIAAPASSGGSTTSSVGVQSSGGGSIYIPSATTAIVQQATSTISTVCPPGALYNSQTGSRCPGTYAYVKSPATPHVPAAPYTYPSVPTSAYVFTHNLTLGSRDPDVKQLQLFLITQGFLNNKYDTGYFGILTRSALSKFQAKYGISPSAGYFGAVTRRAILGK